MAELVTPARWYVFVSLLYHPLIHNFATPALTFVLAPLPNALFAHCGSDDISSYENSAPIDLGRFITAMIVVTGFALPIVLAHSEVINPKACVMSIAGGACVTPKV